MGIFYEWSVEFGGADGNKWSYGGGSSPGISTSTRSVFTAESGGALGRLLKKNIVSFISYVGNFSCRCNYLLIVAVASSGGEVGGSVPLVPLLLGLVC